MWPPHQCTQKYGGDQLKKGTLTRSCSKIQTRGKCHFQILQYAWFQWASGVTQRPRFQFLGRRVPNRPGAGPGWILALKTHFWLF